MKTVGTILLVVLLIALFPVGFLVYKKLNAASPAPAAPPPPLPPSTGKAGNVINGILGAAPPLIAQASDIAGSVGNFINGLGL